MTSSIRLDQGVMLTLILTPRQARALRFAALSTLVALAQGLEGGQSLPRIALDAQEAADKLQEALREVGA